MAAYFTQDAVLHFLQSSGGSAKNSDLLLHFRNFIRDHPDRDRNRDLFKKYVNSVATVKQIDGVSYVVLRKKFKGHQPGGGEGDSSGQPRLPTGKNTEPSPENARLSPAGRAEKPRHKPHMREVTKHAPPPGLTAGKAVLPAAGIMLNNNNNNVETEMNLKQKQQQVISIPEVPGRPAAAQVVRQISEKTEVKTPRLSEPPAQDQPPKVGQHKEGLGPPLGVPPVVAAVRHHVETSQQVPLPEPLRGKQACVQPEGGLHQEPPLHHISLDPQVVPRRFKYRQSYKSAVSYDEDEEEEVEVPVRGGSAGGVWPMSAPLEDMGRAISTSSPCIIGRPAPPSVVSSSSSSSEGKPPKIYIQNVNEEMEPHVGPGRSLEPGVGQRGQWEGPRLKPGSVPGESTSTRRSLPLEAECYITDQAKNLAPYLDVPTNHIYSQTAGVQLEPSQGPDQSPRVQLSSSHNSIFSPSSDAGLSVRDWTPSSAPRGSGLNSSYEDLRAGAGDLCDDREEAESSEGSTSSPQLRQRPAVARRLSSKLRSRMCRSLGADLDQFLQEESGRGLGDNEVARLNRLHMISSSLSLRYNLSSSSLSSCSTPPRCQSLADLVEGVEGKGERRSLPVASSATAHHEGSSRQSLVPLEAREHAWLVKGAAGAWPDIYSLFREDSSLLNRRDFISGFTVLHWIAKHGDHRVLNTLWYGVEKAGLTFDVNARSTCGHTPLHIAAIHGHKNIMRLLVKKFNADVRLRDNAGKKPWQYLSRTVSSDVFQLLGAPSWAAGRAEAGVERVDTSWTPEKHHRRRRRHHFSSASSGERPLTISGAAKVKRSSSIAALLKHKSLRRFHGHQSDSSI